MRGVKYREDTFSALETILALAPLKIDIANPSVTLAETRL